MMTARWLRVGLVLLFGAAVAGSGYVAFDEERARAAATDGLARNESWARTARIAIADLASAERSYVAAGQDAESWIGRAEGLVNDLERTLKDFSGGVASDRARSALQVALSDLARLRQVDERARNNAGQGQRLMASDLIFADAAEIQAALAARVDEARSAELDWHVLALDRARQRELLVLGACLAAGLLIALLLVPLSSREPTTAVTPVDRPAATPSESTELYLTNPPEPPLVQQTVPPEPDLALVASLCTDLARVRDPAALTDILERARSVLNASGVIVWLAEPATGILHPAVSAGYSADRLRHMGAIPVDAPNPTAAAYRTGELQTLAADSSASAALVAPLMAPDVLGVLGVLTLELRPGIPCSEPAGSIAKILASQIAGLVRTVPSTSDIARVQNSA